jgi:teichuronic acid biosynthesis glycosyltransferase TuaC
LRVLVVTTSYPAFEGDPSGHFVATEARHLGRAHDVTVLTAAHAGTRAGLTVEAGGIQVYREPGGSAFGWPGVTARVREQPLALFDAAAWTVRAEKRARTLGPFDQVVAHWAVPSALPIARRVTAPLDVVSHGGDIRLLTALPAPVRTRLVRALLRSTRRWRFVSAELLGDLACMLLPAQRRQLESIAVVEAPLIDIPDVTARARLLRDEHDGERLVVCAGRLVPDKRFDLVVRHVAEREPRGTRLVVVGDGPERGRLERAARDLGVSACFVGRTVREDALAWIGAADALLHASNVEGLSTVVREANALGTPVVVIS